MHNTEYNILELHNYTVNTTSTLSLYSCDYKQLKYYKVFCYNNYYYNAVRSSRPHWDYWVPVTNIDIGLMEYKSPVLSS